MTPVQHRVLKESGQYIGKENQKDGRNDGKYPKEDLMDRLHMNETQALPAQGYRGKDVAHDDMKTATGDWMSEHGTAAHRALQEQYSADGKYGAGAGAGEHGENGEHGKYGEHGENDG